MSIESSPFSKFQTNFFHFFAAYSHGGTVQNCQPCFLHPDTSFLYGAATKEIASAVSGVTQIDYSVVEALPSTGKKGVIYLVANSGSGNNIYDEYIYINSKFEKLGSREMDLSSYAKKTDIPTKVSSLTNDSGYQTAAQVTSAIDAKLVVMTDTELNTMWTEVFGA